MPAVWQEFQAIVDVVNAPADTHRLASLSVPVLWQTLPPEVRHEETHLHPHRYATHVTLRCTNERSTLVIVRRTDKL